jgi:FAD binding domain
VLLLEAHDNFDRDFRGDAVHPSTVGLLEEIGLLDELLALPHAAMFDFPFHYPDGSISPAPSKRDVARRPRSCQVPQHLLLDMLVREARRYPTFHIAMGARVDELLYNGSAVCGLQYTSADGRHAVRASVVVGADGRFSKMRQLAGLQLHVLGPRLLTGTLRTADLAKVQRRRELPTRLMQAMQRRMNPFADDGTVQLQPPLPLRLVLNSAPVVDLRRRLISYGGWRPERVRKSAPFHCELRATAARLLTWTGNGLWKSMCSIDVRALQVCVGMYPYSLPAHGHDPAQPIETMAPGSRCNAGRGAHDAR